MKKLRLWIGGFCSLLALAVVLSGCQTGPTPTFSSGGGGFDPLFAADPLSPGAGGGTNDNRRWVFNPEDNINITFIGPEGTLIPPFDGRISEQGTITLPLIGTVQAAGKTAAEIERDIHKAYVPQYYLRLTVTVRGQARFYFVGGEVKVPNRYEWTGELTVTKAIQTAGDFTDWANKKNVTVTRADGSTIRSINCVKILEGKSPDVPVYAGDKIHVRRRIF
jgi:protein involved in polysaccharide export with SLBB domain